MSKLRVESLTISLDGFGAGPNLDIDNPLGVGGGSLHGWAVSTRTFQRLVFGTEGGSAEGVDEDFAAKGFRNVGAWILGRNMFGPVRGLRPGPGRPPAERTSTSVVASMSSSSILVID